MLSNGVPLETSISSPLESEPVTPVVAHAPEFPISPPTSATLDFAQRTPLKEVKVQVQEHATIEPTPPTQVTSEQENAKPAPTNGETPKEDKGLRVLLVEDNEINLKLLIATMRKLKLDHATAVNGLEAFNSYKDCEGKFDVIFMGALLFPNIIPYLQPY